MAVGLKLRVREHMKMTSVLECGEMFIADYKTHSLDSTEPTLALTEAQLCNTHTMVCPLQQLHK